MNELKKILNKEYNIQRKKHYKILKDLLKQRKIIIHENDYAFCDPFRLYDKERGYYFMLLKYKIYFTSSYDGENVIRKLGDGYTPGKMVTLKLKYITGE